MAILTKTLKSESNEKSAAILLIKGTLEIMEKLIKVMSAEIELIGARKMKEHSELLKIKQRLTMDYRANMKSIAAQPDILKIMPEDVRGAVKASAQKLADMTDRNAKFLRSSVMATQRLIQNIVSIVKKEALPKNSYGNSKTAHLALGTYSPTCKPVAIVRTA